MATFDSFTVAYNSVRQRYDLSYTYTPNITPYVITAIINRNRTEYLINTASGTIEIPNSGYPQYFTQGISMEIYLESDDGGTQSPYLYRVFMRETDATNNISLASNVRRWTISDSNADYTSVVLPPIATFKNQPFSFKYIDGNTTKSFAIVSGYQGYSNAPTSQLLTSVDSNFNSIFDYKFDSNNTTGNIGRVETTSAYNLASLTYVSDGTQWLGTNIYLYDSNLAITSAPVPASNKNDSNKSILFYECTDSNLSTVVLSDQLPNNFEKNIFFRNLSGTDLTFHLLAPTGFDFENTANVSDRAQLAVTCSNEKCVNLGLLSQFRSGTNNRLYITSLYRGQGLTKLEEYPTVSMTSLNKSINYIQSVDPSLRVPNAEINSNYSRIFTVVAKNNGDFSTISTFENNSSNYFVVDGSNTTRTLNLDSNYWYTFASLYKNATNTNVILPLTGYTL